LLRYSVAVALVHNFSFQDDVGGNLKMAIPFFLLFVRLFTINSVVNKNPVGAVYRGKKLVIKRE
jgi:hypothetical protein